MADKERLIQLQNAVLAEPEKHDQRGWATRPVNATCGTTMCLAGTAAHLSGEFIDWEGAREEEDENGQPVLVASRVTSGRFIEDVARAWLGLTIDQEAQLFFTMNNADALDNLEILIERS